MLMIGVTGEDELQVVETSWTIAGVGFGRGSMLEASVLLPFACSTALSVYIASGQIEGSNTADMEVMQLDQLCCWNTNPDCR